MQMNTQEFEILGQIIAGHNRRGWLKDFGVKLNECTRSNFVYARLSEFAGGHTRIPEYLANLIRVMAERELLAREYERLSKSGHI